jgi:hypothetical protein
MERHTELPGLPLEMEHTEAGWRVAGFGPEGEDLLAATQIG